MADLIRIEELCVERDGRPVLTGVSLTLRDRERLAILGANGAGKTTLLRAIVGLEMITSGCVTLFGETCRQEREFRPYRPRIGFLFQDSDDQLFCPIVIEDVAFGPLNTGCSQTEAEARARAALASLGITHLAERATHRLSGGEKRLVCLAGLLAMGPDVLLLDEPTNGVDHSNGALLDAALHTFDGAMILVSHNESFVSRMGTRAAILDQGKLTTSDIYDHAHS